MADSILDYLPIIIDGATTTGIITIVAIFAGVLIGALLTLMSFNEKRFLTLIADTYSQSFRSVPLIMVLLGFYLVAPGLLKSLFHIHADVRLATALVAFSLFEGAYFAELFKTGINAIKQDQLPACQSLGLTRFQSFKLVILPQAYQNIRPSLITQSIILLQDTALVYAIGLQDFFGSVTKIGERTGNIPETIALASFCYLVVCIVMQGLADKIAESNKEKQLKARYTSFNKE